MKRYIIGFGTKMSAQGVCPASWGVSRALGFHLLRQINKKLIPGSQGQILILSTTVDKELDFNSLCESLLTQDIL